MVGICGLFAAMLVPWLGAADEEQGLRFDWHGEPVKSATLAELRSAVPEVEIEVHEPYEAKAIDFEAVPFDRLLDSVYGKRWREEEELLFTCMDGYQPTLPVQRVLDHRAFLAFDRPGPQGFTVHKFESGERRNVDVGPFYLIWDNLHDEVLRRDGDFGWPYQLVGIDLIRASDRYPKMTPPADSPPNVLSGFKAFRMHCSRCHKLNGEGGTIGPELVLGGGPVDYSQREWLHKWIDDPASIYPKARMERLNPALPNRARTIDEILDYLEVMSRQAHESAPEASGDG